MGYNLPCIILFLSLGASLVSMEELSYHGNVTVVGLFEIFKSENGKCGTRVVPSSVMAAEAVKWYLKRLNEAGDTTLNIGLTGYKTCRLDSEASLLAIDVMSKTLNKDNGSKPTFIGVIGPEYSSEVKAIAPILSSTGADSRLLMVGYSTTAEPIGNPDNTFPNFFRVVPNDRVQVEMIVKSMKAMEWNRIAIVYEDDLYGRTAMQSLTEHAESNNICVSYTAPINTTNGVDPNELEKIGNEMLIGSSQRPTIKGFVFFGSELTANLLLQKMASLGFSNVPVGLFSDGINLDTNVFNSQGTIIPMSKGSLASSPTYRVIEEFRDHLKDIFTNKSKFELERATNPWLYNVYTELAQCDSCEFAPLTDDGLIEFQPLYVQYALMAAHTVVKAFNGVYTSYCHVNPSSCDFLEHFQQGDMIKTVDTIQLHFNTDFSVRLESLADVQMSFDRRGEPQLGETTPAYQLFNLRHADLDQGPVTFVKVGDFANGTMILNTSDVIDYPDDSTPMAWPNVRKGQCGADQLCEECIRTDLPFMYVHDPGDLYIVGLVPVHDKSGTQGCGNIRPYQGYQLVEGIRLAAQKFNDPAGLYRKYHPGVKVGVIVINTCNNPAVAQRQILELHRHGLRLPNGDLVPMENRILGYAGPLGSTVSISVARVLGNLNKVSVSYAATNPTLSDRQAYKYFMRVVSPDNEQANAMSKILEQLDVNYVQVLYSEGAYGEGGIASLRSVLKAKDICVIQAIEVPESSSHSYYAYYENLRKYPHAKVVIIFIRSHVVRPLMDILTNQMEQGEFIFIGSEAWGKATAVLDNDAKQALLGSYSIVIEMAQDSELLSRVQKIQPEAYFVNPWSRQYLQDKWKCYYSTSYNKQYPNTCEESVSVVTSLDGWATSAYISALAMLIGSGSFMLENCGYGKPVLCDAYLNNPTGLVIKMQNTARYDIYGTGIPQKLFNDNGDGNVGYAVYNIQKDPDDVQALRYIKVGQYPLLGKFTFDKSLIAYPTPAGLVSRCPNQQACASCIDQPPASPVEGNNEDLNAAVIALVVLLMICVGVVIVLAVLHYLYRRRQLRKDKEIYITPTTVEEERRERKYMDFDRPAALGQSVEEECAEPPHHTNAYTSSIEPIEQSSPL